LPDFDITLPSFAKINWTLRVPGRRADGYHEIITLLQTVSLADRLDFKRRDDGRVTLTYEGGPQIPLDHTNLILRAANALQDGYKLTGTGAEIHLSKQIAAGGGLGGGSSNAAMALLGLAELWELPATAAELREIGARLGADVPFFLHGGLALGTGTGTDLETVPDLPAQRLVIVAPGVGVSTAAAYRALNAKDLTKADSTHILAVSREARAIAESFPTALRNDFEPVVFQQEPEIGRAKGLLIKSGASAALMSGSGSSVFGLFDNQAAQVRACSQLKNEPGWRVFACETLTQAAYRQALGLCAARLLA
jgi:4-diphosphocytidyl-2-C-methyl-D-erythritol kinase